MFYSRESHTHPATGEQVASFPVAGPADVDLAVRAARRAFDEDVRRAMRVTKAIRAGTVGINGYQLEPNFPFGGYRQSGIGREGGRSAIESYTELKTVLLPFTDEMM